MDNGPQLAAAGLVHRVWPPEAAAGATAQRPTAGGARAAVVLLHGLGGDEDSMWVFARTIGRDCVLLAPRAPEAVEQGYAWRPRAADEWPSISDFKPAAAVLASFVDALPDLYGIDAARVGFMGFSQGAAVAYAMALTRPGATTSIAALVGFLPDLDAATVPGQPLAGTHIFAAAGAADPHIPRARSDADAELLAAAGADVTYRVYPGGHHIDQRGMTDLADWWGRRLHCDPT